MKRILLTVCLCFASAALAVDLYALQAELETLLPNDDAGVAIAYVSPEGEKEVFIGNDAFNEGTLFEYGSLTKVFTAIVLAQLAQEGRIELEASLNEYLPEDVRVQKWQDVTLWNLATHTAGLPRLPQDMGFLYTLRFGENPYAAYNEERLMQAVVQVELEPQGTYNSYSNFGFGLLGTLLGRASQKSYATLVEERIFAPLKMANATVHGWASDEVAPPIWNDGTEGGYWDFDALAGAGAARGSLLDAKKFLEASLQACSQTDARARANCKAQQPTLVKAGKYMTQGLGWIRSESPAGDIVWHNGGTGGFSTFLGFNPKTRMGLVILANVADFDEVTTLSLEALSTQR